MEKLTKGQLAIKYIIIISIYVETGYVCHLFQTQLCKYCTMTMLTFLDKANFMQTFKQLCV